MGEFVSLYMSIQDILINNFQMKTVTKKSIQNKCTRTMTNQPTNQLNNKWTGGVIVKLHFLYLFISYCILRKAIIFSDFFSPKINNDNNNNTDIFVPAPLWLICCRLISTDFEIRS